MIGRAIVIIFIILTWGAFEAAQTSDLPELDQYVRQALGSNLKIRQTLELIREKQAARDEAKQATIDEVREGVRSVFTSLFD